MSGYTDYHQMASRPINLPILLTYILSNEQESPKNLVVNEYYLAFLYLIKLIEI